MIGPPPGRAIFQENKEADGAFAVVYRRNDGDYGLIQDEQ